MASYTKAQRRQVEEVQAKIMAGYRRGVCDSEGRSVRDGQGAFIARPRNIPPTAKRYIYDKQGNRTQVA